VERPLAFVGKCIVLMKGVFVKELGMKANPCRKMRLFRMANTLVSVITLIFFSAGSVFALPTGQQVVNGQAAFNTQGANLTITNSPNAIINWQGFSINNNEAVRFIQQSSTSAVLNRVIGQDPSRILGLLQSNGRVFLINPNGILFGQGARIDVNGLVASTLNISNQDFLAGKYNFTAGAVAGSIQNQGTITTPEGGSVYLIAPDIENSGIINSPKGDVILAAGHSVHLVDSLSPDIAVVVSAPENTAVNLGQILAQSGKVGIYGGLISQKGIVNADSAVVGENGRIFFKASQDVTLDAGSTTTTNGPQGGQITIQSESGTTLVSGTVTATGNDGKGGDIQVLGNQVGLIDNARIDASGKNGGGTILIGGDYQGGNSAIQNAETTSVGKDVVIKADALEAGDGGKVVLWADDKTEFYGRINARGGATGGDGGLVETSGHKLSIGGTALVNTSAFQGKSGLWLLDPVDFTIAASGGDMTGTTLGGNLAGGNITIFSSSGSTGVNGDINVNDTVSWTSSNSLTLSAYRNINFNQSLSSTGGGNLVLRADSFGTGVGTVIFAGAGSVSLTGGTGGKTASIYYNPANYLAATYNADVATFNTSVTAGTRTYYMLVNDEFDLQAINTNLAGRYAQGTNINASVTSGWNGGLGFDPIGNYVAGQEFTGVFDGLGRTISGLFIKRPLESFLGLFGSATDAVAATIANVGLVNVSITGGFQTGGLLGRVSGTVSNCYVTGTVTGTSDYVGGLVGLNAGSVSDSYSTATVNGNIYGSTYVGGLVGRLDTGGSITNSYSTGVVTGFASVGGLVGYNYGVGPIVNSYWDTDTSLQDISDGGTGKTTAEMKQQATFAGWDFTNTWAITENVNYPWIIGNASLTPPPYTPPPPTPAPSSTAAPGVTGNTVAIDNTVVALEAAAGGVTLEAVDEGISDDQKGGEAQQSDKKDKDGGEQTTYEKTQGEKGKIFCN
jgi:filamentous hemagglutinin family protein